MIRKVKEHDLSKVMELIQLHSDWEKSPYTEGVDDKENLRKQIFEKGDLNCLVIEVNGEVVIWIVCFYTRITEVKGGEKNSSTTLKKMVYPCSGKHPHTILWVLGFITI
jgi:hypothetical protein